MSFAPEQRKVLSDLLKEKTLWEIYRQSWRIKLSTFNCWASIVVGLAIAVVSGMTSTTFSPISNLLASIASVGFGASVSLLGFLLAGFSFFATVSDKLLFSRMAESPHECGLSYLKYNFFVFMRVFVEYLVFAVLSLVVLVCFQKDAPVGEHIAEVLDAASWPPRFWLPGTPSAMIGSLLLGAYLGLFVFILLQLKSFIFNINHVVMTNIRWSLENEYLKKNSEAEEDSSKNPPT
jgi:hypothetical protein